MAFIKLNRAAVLVSCVMQITVLSAATHYLVPAGTAGNTPTSPYTSWATAANDLDAVVAACGSGDTILVSPGAYAPVSGVVDTLGSLTIRSCDPQTGLADAEGTVFDGANRTAVSPWLSFKDVAGATRLEGFTFRNFPASVVTITNSHAVTISDCAFTDNGGSGDGGALYLCDASGSVVTNCAFTGNKAGSGKYGGAIYAYQSEFNVSVVVADCSFEGGNDVVATSGGAIYANKMVVVRNCTFKNLKTDTSSWSSAGAAMNVGARSLVERCTFSGALAAKYGQAINLVSRSACVSNCVFTGITITGDYGLIHIADGVVACCAFTNNSSLAAGVLFVEGKGSAGERAFRNNLVAGNNNIGQYLIRMYESYSENVDGDKPSAHLYIDNCTIRHAAGPKAIVGTKIGYAHFRNTYMVGPSGTDSVLEVDYENCITTEGYDDFVRTRAGDYRFKSGSQCIDAGASLDWHAGAVDILGRPRVAGAGVDVGCFERQADDIDYTAKVLAVASEADRTGEWSGAHVGFKAAVDAAPDGAWVEVRSGTYAITETVVVSNKAMRISSRNPATGLPDPEGTILDGQGGRRIMIIHHGPHSNKAIPTGNNPVKLEGFTFKHGFTDADDGQPWSGYGGGLVFFGRAPYSVYAPSASWEGFVSRIKNCRFAGCKAVSGGAAAIVGGIFEGCVFDGNAATNVADRGGGGAIGLIAGNADEACRLILRNYSGLWTASGFLDCVFTNNYASRSGGCIGGNVLYEGGAGTILAENCSFLGNHSLGGESSYGSVANGIYGSMITNCQFAGNSGANYDLFNTWSGDMLVIDSRFDSNNAKYGVIAQDTYAGRGTCVMERCIVRKHAGHAVFGNSIFRNTLFCENANTSHEYVRFYGDGTDHLGYMPLFENCTFVASGMKIVAANTSHIWRPTFVNCIFARTDDGTDLFGTLKVGGTVSFTNCLFSSAAPQNLGAAIDAVGSRTGDPRFQNVALGDYSIRRASPARDAGFKLDWMNADSLDLAHLPRVVTEAVTLAGNPSAMPDIGCYENQTRAKGMTINFK